MFNFYHKLSKLILSLVKHHYSIHTKRKRKKRRKKRGVYGSTCDIYNIPLLYPYFVTKKDRKHEHHYMERLNAIPPAQEQQQKKKKTCRNYRSVFCWLAAVASSNLRPSTTLSRPYATYFIDFAFASTSTVAYGILCYSMTVL